jgi:hypothetical protein
MVRKSISMLSVWISLLLIFSSLCHGDEVEISFVPPPMEGTISMGIYDGGGRLVRVLHEEADSADFTVGLDGLITRWDGRTDNGEVAPDGTYSARGIVVGDLDIEGQAYQFNDWIVDESSPRIRGIRNIQTLPNGWLLMLVERARGGLALVRCDREGRIVWNQRLPETFHGSVLTANERDQFVANGSQVVRMDLISGKATTWDTDGDVTAMAADGEVVAVASGTKTRVYRVDNQSILMDLDADYPIESIAIRGESLASVQNGRIYLSGDREWEVLDQPSLTKATEISLTPERKIWVIDAGAEGVEVKEFSREGEFERRLKPETDSPEPVRISVSEDEREVYLLEKDAQRQRVRRLVLLGRESTEEGGEATSLWQVAFSRDIVDVSNPGKLALEDAEGTAFKPAELVTVRLRPNPLEKDVAEEIELMIEVDKEGSRIALADGLPVCHVTETPHLQWALIGPGPKEGEITFFQSDGAVVEEYVGRRLSNMMRFDAGDFEMGKGMAESVPEESGP